MKYSNLLLDTFPAEVKNSIRGKVKLVQLNTGDVLNPYKERTSLMYFPVTGVVSLFASTCHSGQEKGLALGLVGDESAIGLQSALGIKCSENLCFKVQVAGYGYAMKVSDFKNLLKNKPNLSAVTSDFLFRQYQGIAKLATISYFQDVKIRLIYWLLLCKEKSKKDTFYMTQEKISQMLEGCWVIRPSNRPLAKPGFRRQSSGALGSWCGHNRA